MLSFAILPVLYFIPGSDQGSYENALDALVMIKNDGPLLALNLLYSMSIAFYNFFGLSVAKQLSTVHRTLIGQLVDERSMTIDPDYRCPSYDRRLDGEPIHLLCNRPRLR